ncbi:hypothetical protein [Actinoplanes sp. L3-i22]|uniref:hypothetical protein n=1 Tax=Actinoplanes sp. L3-i22 TaxID=2836373 RepID=UPI001C74B7A7|nr:hypothetical protein [Actinoplanes sp. L3-i22]BCY06877.1 hypothetical protein L3i22_019650 [Actinoplanes sp. L3-i22]
MARSVAVNLDGTPQPAELHPVVSSALVMSIVVDASAAGADALPSWLSAAARFSLAAPTGTRTMLIPDREPAKVLTGPLPGPARVVRALNTVRPAGDRDTAAALTLAAQQFPGTEVGRGVTLLYTSAERADGLTATQLADRFRSAGILLVVIGTSDPDRYWSSAAAATGGFYAPAGDPVVVPALDQVESTLSARYLVRFATPATLPAHASISIRTGDVILSAETTLGGPAGPTRHPRWFLVVVLAPLLLFLLLLAFLLVLAGWRNRRTRLSRTAPSSPSGILPNSQPLPPPLSRSTPLPEQRHPGRMRPPPHGHATVANPTPQDDP